jgi:tRNA(His) guanylyltransferase
LVQQDSLSHQDAQKILKDTDSGQKNELLFSKFGINYNTLPEMFRKGSFVSRQKVESLETTKEGRQITRMRSKVTIQHIDIIGDLFWNRVGQELIS